jgi:hypothetical protein
VSGLFAADEADRVLLHDELDLGVRQETEPFPDLGRDGDLALW